MLTAGADLNQFKRNPILLFMHNRPFRGTQDQILAIGKVVDIRLDGDSILGDLEFDQNDPFAKKIETKWDSGIYKMVSAGATPIEYSDDPAYLVPGQTRSTITRWKLDEVSVVDIGANDDAIALKSPKGEYLTLKEGECPDFIPLITPNQTEIKMKKIALALGLGEGATEDEIVAAITAQQTEHRTLAESVKLQNKKSIELAVESAIQQKRITAEKRDHFITLGEKAGIESLSVTLAAIEPVTKPTQLLSGGKSPIELKDKKWDDLSDTERVQLKAEDKTSYIKLFKAHYGFEPKID